MIIKCPSCGRRFDLQRKAPNTFRCPKCGFTTPFSTLLNASASTSSFDGNAFSQPTKDSIPTGIDSQSNGSSDATKAIPELQDRFGKTEIVQKPQADYKKTRIVPELQNRPSAFFQIIANGRPVKSIPLRLSNNPVSLGRNSSDSNAMIKLSPDITMSRVHAFVQSLKGPDGSIQFILKPAKPDNPVFVNNQPIPMGKAVILANNNVIRMGQTTIVFKK